MREQPGERTHSAVFELFEGDWHLTTSMPLAGLSFHSFFAPLLRWGGSYGAFGVIVAPWIGQQIQTFRSQRASFNR
jgi:hypothetical protein